MTYLRYIILPFLLLLSFAGCTKDEGENVVNGEIRLLLNIPGATLTKSITAETGESTISNVYLLFYAQGAADADAPAFFHSETGLSADGTWSKSFKTTEMPGLEPHTTYDVYVLASLPTGVSAPTATTTKGTLLALEEKLTDQTTSSPSISFSGTSTYTTGVLGEQMIDLKRTVARFDITLDNQTSAQNIKVSLVEEPSSVFYLKGKTDSPLTNTNRIASTISGNLYRLYLYEHTADSRPVSIYVSGTTAAGEPISHYIQIEPDGSSQIKRNHIYNISLTLQVDDITVSVGKPVDWSEVVANTPSLSDIVMQPSSNTYIVAPNGKPIRIPVNRPELFNSEASGKYTPTPVITPGEKLEAELVWTDVKGAVSGLGMAVDASIADIQVIGSGPDASLLVTPGTQAGNSMVAIKGADGTVKWSWQIWVTDYNPEVDNVIYNGITFMDRNLGANTKEPSLDNQNSNKVVGTYYQWGRPTAFPTRGAIAGTSASLIPTYKADGTSISINEGTAIGRETDISGIIPYPYWLIKNLYVDATDLWGSSTTKTALDPCPSGWRIPDKSTWDGVSFSPTTGGVSGDAGFYPNSGIMNRGAVGSLTISTFWTSTPRIVDGKGDSPFGFRSDQQSEPFQGLMCIFGLPVRCIKDTQP